MIVSRVFRWFDERLQASTFARRALNKVFPDHWSFLFGELALYSFVILLLTGIYLTFFFVPSADEVVYRGAYAPLHGETISAAYRSVLRLSFEVRAGLVMRQMHHWAALLFMASIVVHLCRVFFTGAFRKPREINWIIGVGLLTLGLFNGFTGYSLPDDLLSGTGLRIAYSIALSIPVVGTWLAYLVFGGEFPTQDVLSRLFVLHVLIGPGLIVGALSAHLGIIWRQKHTQFPGKGRSEKVIEGSLLWPSYALKTAGLLLLVAAVTAALGGLVQINPVWIYGPFRPHDVSAGSQPDWYLGWLEGALRLMPAWELRAFGFTVPNPFFPAVLLPGITFTLLGMWPFLEARFRKDRDAHNLLERPRDAPLRTALGAAALSFYIVLFIGGGNDVLAHLLDLDVEQVVTILRVMLLAAPLTVGYVAYRVCRELASGDEKPVAGPSGHVLVRTQSGGFREDEAQR